ncbi:MAG TPA: hypothetical protein ENI39_08225 [Anaerolineae bacterium]|nr:hypothetical protein [Anaerolineae bacterium]
MEKQFHILRIVGTLYKIISWIVLVLGILSAFGTLALGIAGGTLVPREYGRMVPASGLLGGVLGFLVALLITAIYFVALYAFGELIYLFLAIEENTRETALWLRNRQSATPQGQVPQSGLPSPPA